MLSLGGSEGTADNRRPPPHVSGERLFHRANGPAVDASGLDADKKNAVGPGIASEPGRIAGVKVEHDVTNYHGDLASSEAAPMTTSEIGQ